MKTLRFEQREHVGILTVDRPAALNALNQLVLEELDRFLADVKRREKIRVLVVTGAGETAFVAGADIKEMQTLDHAGILLLAKSVRAKTRENTDDYSCFNSFSAARIVAPSTRW